MLTVEEALHLDQFAGAQVVAGQIGLQQTIAWVHIVGVPDAPQWLNGGELVLTTALNIPEQPEERRRYVQAMSEKGVVALALAVGRYIDHIPDYMRQVADEHGLPLIEIPYQLRFVDVARTTNERIMGEHMAMVTRALNIHRTLTQLVLEGGDLQALASTLAGLVGQSISIENERFEALASANIAEVDEARRFTLSEGRTDPRLVQALHDRGIIAEIQRTSRPVFIPQMPDVGLELERILAPVIVHGDLYGYVWIIADDRPLSDLDGLAIESGATIAALMLLHQEAVQSAEASLKGSLLAQLIQGEPGREAIMTDQALRYGLDLTLPLALLLVESTDRSSARLIQLYQRVNRLAAPFESDAAVVGQFAGQVVIVAQGDTLKLAKRLGAGLGAGVRVGVSASARGAGTVGAAYQQAREALYVSQRLRDLSAVVCFNDLGYLHTLYQAGSGSLATNPYVPGVRLLFAEQQADLFNTLETYLDTGSNGVQTADVLHIHRSTLNYRLARIADLTGADLSDPTARVNLQIAVKLLRLFENQP